MNNHKRSVFIIAGCGFAVLFVCLTTLFGKVSDAKIPSGNLGDWIANWIYAYQALLSAIIATAGVLLTIVAMNKNNKELLYVEWRTLVFKAMNVQAYLNVAKEAHVKLTSEEIYSIDNLETMHMHCEIVMSNLIRTSYVLNNVLNTDLALYTQGHIATDIISLNNRLNLFLPKLIKFLNIQSFDEFSIRDYKELLISMNIIFDEVNDRTASFIGHFIDHSRKFNPLNLHVKAF